MREINRLSVQQWLRSAISDSQQPISPIGFLFLKLPPPPCAVLLVLQSLRKALPSTTLYYKACTKHFPVLLCITKLAENTSQYYFVLQSRHKALPTLYNLHSTLHTQHFTLHTLHFALDTPPSSLHTLHSTLYTLHSTPYTPHSTLYTPHSNSTLATAA